MITLNKIRELVLSQEQELEKLIFEYFLQKDITNYHNSSFNKNDKKNEIKLSIEDMILQGNLEKAKELLYKYKEISGKDASYYSIAGIISLNENNIEDAFEKFTKGLNIDNTNSDLLYNIAYLNLVVGNTDEALEYYKRCINNTDDKDLIIEVTDIIDKLQDKISHTLITFGLTKEESMNFKGENRVIALIENDNLEHENNYEENGIINYEVNSKKSKDILGYLVRRNKNCIIIFKDIDKIDYINNFKNSAQIAYYQNKNYYTDKSNYLNHNIDMYLEKEVCNTCEFIFTSDISVYNAKKIIERRDNIYLIDENIGNEFTIDYIFKNIGKYYERELEDKLREYSKNLDDIYIKSLYLIAAESNNLNNSIKIAKTINDEYKTEESYLLYITLLNQAKDYNNLIINIINSEYIEDIYKAEILYLNSIKNTDLISFIVNIATNNYKMAELQLHDEINYKRALYYFELNKFDLSLNKYKDIQNSESKFINSPLVNRNIAYLLYANRNENYEKFYNFYKELMEIYK